MGISAEIGADSLVATLSAWVLSSTEMGSDGGIEASGGAPYVSAATKVEAMASATTSALLKKPSIGALVVARASLLIR